VTEILKQATPPVAAFRSWLAKGPHLLDGGLATELENARYDLHDTLWSARLLRDDPGAIRRVHESYFAAGARIATTASYQASRRGFATVGLEPDAADDMLRRSVELAKQARDSFATLEPSEELWIAASVGPYGAVLAGGQEYHGGYGLSIDELTGFHDERIAVLASADPDLLAVETIPDLLEVAALAEVLPRYPQLPVWISISCRDGESTNAGDQIGDAVVLLAEVPNLVAIGVNCTAPEYVSELLTKLRIACTAVGRDDLSLLAYPNTGRVWNAKNGDWEGEGSDVLPDQIVSEWLAIGANLVGGCCGLGPPAISAMNTLLGRLDRT
jgi:homocysteine S-methyltransferase